MDFFESVADKIAAGTERGKELGSKVLKQATTTSKTVRDGVTATAKAAKEQALLAARAVKNKAVETAQATQARVEDAAQAVKNKAIETAHDVADKARASADWTKEKAGQVADWGKEKGQQAAQVVGDGVTTAKEKIGEGVAVAKKKAGEAVDWSKDKANGVVDWASGGIASGVGRAATANNRVEKCIENAARNKNRVADPQDGQYMGNNCPQSSATPPKTGRLPEGCGGSGGSGGKLPKIIYTNGINTPPAAACATMRQIANERCAEVIGVYNATYGTIEDGLDSKDNIDRAGKEPAAKSQAALMTQMLNAKPPQPVTLYSHSQGGLITQEGLSQTEKKLQREKYDVMLEKGMSKAEAKEKSERDTRIAMRNVDVYSFGTAENDWPPTGAKLHQFTNTSDPVPKLIGGVQRSRGTYDAPMYLNERHRFTKNFLNPINAHSMDNTYLPELNRVKPVPKNANGKCC